MSVDIISYVVFSLTYIAIFAIATLGTNLQYGYAGLFNVGIAGFFAIGSYTTAILTGPEWPQAIGGFGLPVAIGVLCATIVSCLAALLIGKIVLRLGGDYLAIATFGVGVSIQLVALNSDRLTQGPNGLFGIPRPLREAGTGIAGNASWLALCVAALCIVWWGLSRATATPWGRSLRALSEDEIAAAGAGKDVARFKLEAFVAGSGLCGLSGALYAHFTGFISPQDFLPILTFQIYAMMIVGGVGRHAGAVLGTFVVWEIWSTSSILLGSSLPASWQDRVGALRIVLIALCLLAVLLMRPSGLLGQRNPGFNLKRLIR